MDATVTNNDVYLLHLIVLILVANRLKVQVVRIMMVKSLENYKKLFFFEVDHGLSSSPGRKKVLYFEKSI